MRIIARSPGNAVVQADEADTGLDVVVAFDMVQDPTLGWLIESYEQSGEWLVPHLDKVKLGVKAIEFLRHVTAGVHS